jgi:hypothetical protein
VQRLRDETVARIEKSHPGLVATCFKAQYQHRRRMIPERRHYLSEGIEIGQIRGPRQPGHARFRYPDFANPGESR